MIFSCVLCEKETCYISKFCDKCRRIKHYLNLYDERVYDILDNVLSRTDDKIKNKEKLEIHKEIENKEFKLKKHIKRGVNEN